MKSTLAAWLKVSNLEPGIAENCRLNRRMKATDIFPVGDVRGSTTALAMMFGTLSSLVTFVMTVDVEVLDCCVAHIDTRQ
jgi:hypothetical protein